MISLKHFLLGESYSSTLKKIISKLKKFNVEYMFIGKGSAIMQGYNDTTQDIDIFPKKSIENSENLIKALKSLKFKLTDKDIADIKDGKDFIQFNSPFEFDLVFAPDGFENYEDGEQYKKNIDGIPVMSVEGIIKSKQATGRPKDKHDIEPLKDFKKYLNEGNSQASIEVQNGNYYEVPFGYKMTDYQTINRWENNINNYSLFERVEKGHR